MSDDDDALDQLFDIVFALGQRGSLDEINEFIVTNPAHTLSTTLIIGMLTATAPDKSLLPDRAAFYADGERVIKERGEWEPGLFSGLD